MKRHQVLGKDLVENLETTLATIARREQKWRSRLRGENASQLSARVNLIELALQWAIMQHLGYGPVDRLHERMIAAAEEAVEFFCGDWWTANPEDRTGRTKEGRLDWLSLIDPMPEALFLCGLSQRWNDATRIADWYEERFVPELGSVGADEDESLFWLYVASRLRSRPFACELELASAIDAFPSRRSRLMLSAWQAAEIGDQAGFDRALVESIKQFLRQDAEDVPNVRFWVALNQSVIWLFAERRGLRLPKLPDKCEAALVRRQTVGLAPD